jgi:hypothetical protein
MGKIAKNKFEVWWGSWFGSFECDSLGYVIFDPDFPPFTEDFLEPGSEPFLSLVFEP